VSAELRALSYWHDSAGDAFTPRPALPGDVDVDVAVVGGGLTGLWTARYLAEADPSLRIMVLEAEVCGFGASGRNGGWCSALLPMRAPDMSAAMRDTVDEVGRAAADDGIDCHFAKGGTLTLVTNSAQERRVRAEAEQDGYEWLDREAAAKRFAVSGLLGAAYTPDCAAIHPARLVRGLAGAVERRGVTVHEGTRVERILPGVVLTGRGRVRAEIVLRCTEGYTPRLRGLRREVIPIYSLMIATEPMPDEWWADVGLRERETFSDGRPLLIYGQRTADGRFAFGGRGAPYHFASRIEPGFDRDDGVFAEIERVLRGLVPQLGDARVTHRWGGPLAAPRDWRASVAYDRISGMGRAGGYVGDGVATTNLAGRTLCDLVLGRQTERTQLSWVGHSSRRWEPEPLRWLGVNLGRNVVARTDAREARTGRESSGWNRAMRWFTG
jgi:glycine/D-amino acid oxidase-like deaminating enzyme